MPSRRPDTDPYHEVALTFARSPAASGTGAPPPHPTRSMSIAERCAEVRSFFVPLLELAPAVEES